MGAAERRPDADLMGKYKVPHFDAKGEADRIFRTLGVPTTFLLTSFYWDNFDLLRRGAARRGPDGKLAITFPMGDKKLPGIAAEDIGKCAYGDLQAREGVHRQDGGHRRRAPDRARRWRRRSRQALGQEVALQRRAARGVPRASAFPAPTTWATCSSSSATSRRTSAGRATRPLPVASIPRCKTLTRGWRKTRAGSRLHKEGEVA